MAQDRRCFATHTPRHNRSNRWSKRPSGVGWGKVGCHGGDTKYHSQAATPRMDKCPEGYTAVLVESFYSDEPGHRYPVEIRPLPSQPFPTDLLVECAMSMREKYPVGTVFRICAKQKQKADCRSHLYTSFKWPYEVVELAKQK